MGKMRRWFHVSEAWRRWRAGEGGFAETATAIIVLPFMMATIFVLIEAGYNFSHRSRVEMVAQDAARGVAMDGANYWAATSTLDPKYATSVGGRNGWSRWGTEELRALCNSGKRCTDAGTYLDCTPTSPQVDPGATVTCTATVDYKQLVPFSSNPIFSLGFSGLWSKPIKVTVTGQTTVGTG